MKSKTDNTPSSSSGLRCFAYALKGISVLISKQVNFRIHLFAVIAVILGGIILDVSLMEWIILILCMGLVLMLEALNTAIEYTIDLVSPGYHELAGKIKDISAAAVLIAALTSALIGLIIFIPKIFAYSSKPY